LDQQKQGSEQWHSKLFRVVNSAVCFSLAYILFTYGFWFATAISAHRLKFDSLVYYYGIKFLLNGHSWDKAKVALVYSSGSLFVLALGLFCFLLYNMMRKVETLVNVLLLWGFVIGTCIFVAQGLLICLGTYNYTSPYYQNFAVMLSWWRTPMTVAYALIIPFIILFFYFSINYGRSFLIFSYSFAKVNKLSRRRRFFFETALVPYAIGALVTSALTYPMNLPVHIIYLVTIGSALLLAWYSLSYVKVLKYELVRYQTLQRPGLVFIMLLGLLCTLVLFAFRGVYFSP
jgi:hypothetical protein